MVVTKSFSGGSPAGKGQQEVGPDQGGECPPPSAGRGHKKQLMVTMAGKKVNAQQGLCSSHFQIKRQGKKHIGKNKNPVALL